MPNTYDGWAPGPRWPLTSHCCSHGSRGVPSYPRTLLGFCGFELKILVFPESRKILCLSQFFLTSAHKSHQGQGLTSGHLPQSLVTRHSMVHCVAGAQCLRAELYISIVMIYQLLSSNGGQCWPLVCLGPWPGALWDIEIASSDPCL